MTDTSTIEQTPESRAPALLAEAKGLLQQEQFAQAERRVNEAISLEPENDEALYLLAVVQRYAGRPSDALDALARLQQLRPDYGRAFQEEGHCRLALDQPDAALAAFRHAVGLNNSLLASWRALAALLQPHDTAAAQDAATRYQRLHALPRELLSVRNMMAEGRHYRAEQLCRAFLKQNPSHVEAMRLLADMGIRAGVLDDAEFILESALEFEPDNRFARHDYVRVLYLRQKYAESLRQAKRLLEEDPDNDEYRVSYANQCVAVGDYDTALQIYDEVIERVQDRHLLQLLRGHALKTIGDAAPAIEAYRMAYAARPDFGDAYWSLANLKTYRFTPAEERQMIEAESASSTPLEDRIHLCFALGKHFEDQEDFATSMEYYTRGNALKKDQLRYDSRRMTEHFDRQIKDCNSSMVAERQGFGCTADDPIFIVGLPRAGSTLLEQILASHSQVDGTFELPNIPALAFRLAGRRKVDDEPRYPAVLAEMSAEQAAQFGQAYLDDTRIHRGNAPRFIDKMPNNFRHIGLIHLILPNARIIDARREAMACCFSGFKQLFSSGQEFTYGLHEIGQYYQDYVRLMDHWNRVLPGKILRVNYEETVADLETQVRRVLAFCDLPFEQACLDFHQTRRSVRTASSEQVRQPIFTSGLEYWKAFDPWLDPLREALGPELGPELGPGRPTAS